MRLPPSAGGGGGRPLDLNREVSGITGACMAVRRQTFFDVGGFSLDFPLNFNDVDFGFKIIDRGLRIIWTPDARLFHFESKSRITVVSVPEWNRLDAAVGPPDEARSVPPAHVAPSSSSRRTTSGR